MEKKEQDVNTNNEPEIRYRGLKAMPLIIGNEAFEKLGTIGTSNNLLIYLTTVFNMKSVTANTFINVFNGTANFATLPGAFLCDTYFGRYKTLGFASVASLLGMIVLTLTAGVSNLHPPSCENSNSGACHGPTPWQLAFLFSGFGFLVVGAGGIRPCNLAFGADQFNPNTESGKRAINSFFNWYYFTLVFAVMISITVIVYIQSNISWTWGLAIPMFLMFLSCVFFFAGTKIYVKVKASGSPLTSAVRVIVAAFKKRHLKHPEQPWLSLFNHIPPNSTNSNLSYTAQFRFLDKAAIIEADDKINPDGSAANPWRLCSMQQVEEVKCLIRVISIWASFVLFYVSITQLHNYVVFQVLQADRHLGNSGFKIPAASYSVFTMITVTIWIPIYDRILVPRLRKYTGIDSGITILQRIGVGLVLAIVTMILSGLIEDKRRSLALTKPIGKEPKGGAISSLSGFWFVPQLAMMGLSEGFAVIGYIEFYYKQFPENMRSIGGSFLFLGMAMSSYLSGVLVSIIHSTTSGSSMGDWFPDDLNKGKLDYFYYLIAALGVVNFAYFLVCAKWYKYKESSVTPHASEVDMTNTKPEKPVV